MNTNKRVYASRTDFGRWVELRIFSDTGDVFLSAKPIEMVSVDEGSYSEPTVRLSLTEAQSMMDTLWDCGLRPTEGSGSAGALAATQNHLKDLQRIVFKDYPKP